MSKGLCLCLFTLRGCFEGGLVLKKVPDIMRLKHGGPAPSNSNTVASWLLFLWGFFVVGSCDEFLTSPCFSGYSVVEGALAGYSGYTGAAI